MLRRIYPVFVGLPAFGAIIISVGMAIDNDEYWLIADYTTISIFVASAIFLFVFRSKAYGQQLSS